MVSQSPFLTMRNHEYVNMQMIHVFMISQRKQEADPDFIILKRQRFITAENITLTEMFPVCFGQM